MTQPRTGVHVCRFTALDDLPKRQHGDVRAVLEALKAAGRFSVFDATQSPTIAATMTRIMRSGLALDIGGEYPWTRVTISPAGEALLPARGLRRHTRREKAAARG